MSSEEILNLTIAKLQNNQFYKSDFAIIPLQDYLQKIDRDNHYRNKFYSVFMLHEAGGSFVLDNVSFNISPQMLIFINYNQVYHFQDAELINGYVILFTKSFYNHIYTGNKIIKSDTALADIAPFLRTKTENRKDLWQSFVEIRKEYLSSKPLSKEIICLQLKAFILKYIRYSGKTVEHALQPDRKKLIVNEFADLVNTHYKELKATSDYAKMLNLTPNYLNSLIKQNLDISAGKFVKNRVILEAERLLLHTPMSVTAISYELGFSDKSHFGKYFKSEKKLAPHQYRIFKTAEENL